MEDTKVSKIRLRELLEDRKWEENNNRQNSTEVELGMKMKMTELFNKFSGTPIVQTQSLSRY